MTDILEGVLELDFMQDFVQGLFNAYMFIVNLFLLPISLMIKNVIPTFDSALDQLQHVFNYAITYVGWFISAFAIPPVLLTMILGYYTFVVTTRLTLWGAKLMLKWRKAI